MASKRVLYFKSVAEAWWRGDWWREAERREAERLEAERLEAERREVRRRNFRGQKAEQLYYEYVYEKIDHSLLIYKQPLPGIDFSQPEAGLQVHQLNSEGYKSRAIALTVSDFSSGVKQYFAEGDVNGIPVQALPDSGADDCFISQDLASRLGLNTTPKTQKKILLANKKYVRSPGMVKVPWKFTGEPKTHNLDCWILPGCVHNLVLGNHFLRATQTLTKFARRIKSKLIQLPRRLRLRLLGHEKQRLWGTLDGHLIAALPDTGSDVMLISSMFARKNRLTIDRDSKNWLEVEFANGSTALTSGVVRDVPWKVGGKTVRCDFHVLDDLCVDVVLSKNYLFEFNVFSEHHDCFFDADSEEGISQLCNIRLIGQYGDALNILEEKYLEDLKSANAFSPEMIQRELVRRDQIRDKIMDLPENKREAATQAEAERKLRWDNLRQQHKTRVAGVKKDDLQGAIVRKAWWGKPFKLYGSRLLRGTRT